MQDTADILPLHRPQLVNIRAAKIHDLSALSMMISELAADHGDMATASADQLNRDLFGSTPWITAFVAEAAGELIGYAILAPLYRAAEGARGMDLNQIYVRQPHRGTGIGRHLIDKARAHAKTSGCSFLSVSAATGNFKAHRFYENMSFQPRPVTGMRYLQAIA